LGSVRIEGILIQDYVDIMEALSRDDPIELDEIAEIVVDFPDGKDPYLNRYWIIHAVDVGSLPAIRWMLNQQVRVNFVDIEGYSPLHSAIDRASSDRYQIREWLLQSGADPGLHGINDWTPAHLTAARDDVKALRILLSGGADFSIRTV
jgi:ankyrin repeat protein